MLLRFFLLLAVLLGLGAWAYGVVGAPDTPPGSETVAPANPAPLPANRPITVVVLTADGGGQNDWTAQVGRTLSECRGRPVTVERLAAAGASSRWGLKAFRDRVRDPGAPPVDVLIVGFSQNDASLTKGFPLFLSRRNHEAIIRTARDGQTAVFLATLNPAWGQRALKRPGQAGYRALYRDLAAEDGVGLIDTVPAWEGLSPAERNALVPDGLHPSDPAMKRVSVPAFEAALRPLLCPA